MHGERRRAFVRGLEAAAVRRQHLRRQHQREIQAALRQKLLPGRWDEVRQPNAKELKATEILALEIDEASAKVRTGPPDDDDSADAERDTWAGVLPIVTSYGTPEPSPGLRPGIEVSESVRRLLSPPDPPG